MYTKCFASSVNYKHAFIFSWVFLILKYEGVTYNLYRGGLTDFIFSIAK